MSKEFKKNLGTDMSKTLMGYYLDSIYKIEKAIFDEEFEKIGITFSQFKVLNWLWRHGELTQKELHNFVQVKPSSLTKILNILIKKGLVQRQQDPNDARVKKVKTTKAGDAIEQNAWQVVQDFDSKLRGILTQEEYEITVNSLRKLTESLKDQVSI